MEAKLLVAIHDTPNSLIRALQQIVQEQSQQLLLLQMRPAPVDELGTMILTLEIARTPAIQIIRAFQTHAIPCAELTNTEQTLRTQIVQTLELVTIRQIITMHETIVLVCLQMQYFHLPEEVRIVAHGLVATDIQEVAIVA